MNIDSISPIFDLFESLTDPDLLELRDDLYQSAKRYARLRVDWLTDKSLDEPRHLAHNALIDACNILARELGRRGLPTTWRERLGTRQEIGDFACYLHCLLGLKAR
jgi:hypothetical protein